MHPVEHHLQPDRDVMLDQLHHMFGRSLSGRVEITLIRTSADEKGHKIRAQNFPLDAFDKAVEFAREHNLQFGWNAYVGIGLRNEDSAPFGRGDDDDVIALPGIFADADTSEQLERANALVAELGLSPPLMVQTGTAPNRRVQFYWPLEEAVTDRLQMRALQSGMAATLGTDPAVCAASQLMRLGGSISWAKHGKPGRKNEMTAVFHNTAAQQEFAVEQIERACATAVPQSEPNQKSASASTFGIERLSDGRKNFAFRLARAGLHQLIGETGAAPTAQEIYDLVQERFFQRIEDSPDHGPTLLMSKCRETVRAFEKRQIPFARDLDHGVQTYRLRQRDGGSTPSADGDCEYYGTKPDGPGVQKISKSRAVLVSAATIVPEPIKWLWGGWLAAGKIHILAGQPGTGKTSIAVSLAAIISSGGRWPDGSPAQQGRCLLWSGEDGLADTLVPRFLASGGDPDRMHFITGLADGEKQRTFDPAKDMEALQAAAEELGDVRLLIVDPVVSAVSGDGHKNNDVRRGLQPLVDFAGALGCAVVGISHFSKGSGDRPPLERLTGSLAFGALARVVWFAAKQDEDADKGRIERRVLVRAKSNLGPDGGGYDYDAVQSPVPGHGALSATSVVFGEQVEGSARSILDEIESRGDAADPSALENAKDFLQDILNGGRVPVSHIHAKAMAAGIKVPTLQRAKRALGVMSAKGGVQDGWFWMLPKAVAEGDQHPPA